VPSQLTYPGVYVEEIPSGVRTIVGVATSITAFVGLAPRGPVNEPVTIFGFADYERQFGGLSLSSPMSYAVRDFYMNQGRQAIIVRLDVGSTRSTITLPLERDAAQPPGGQPPAQPPGGQPPGGQPPAQPAAAPTDLNLVAVNGGAWGKSLSVKVDYDVGHGTEKITDTSRFNLTVREMDPVTSEVAAEERFLNVSTKDDDPRYLARVLRDGSALVRAKLKDGKTDEWDVPDRRPALTTEDKTHKDEHGNDVTETIPAFKAAGTALDRPADATEAAKLLAAALPGDPNAKTGIYALEKVDLFNLLCIPPFTLAESDQTSDAVYGPALDYCVTRRAVLVVDPRGNWTTVQDVVDKLGELNLTGPAARNAAVFFPRVRVADPLRDNQTITVVPCGAVAGVMARTDAQRGVWKAPAGIDATLNGTRALQLDMTNDENGRLNPLGVNCLRSFQGFGRVVWGARTLRGSDLAADEYKYLPVRRLALYIEESLYRGTQWVVFEPNDEPLWAQIRLNVGAFMHDLFRQGAFQGDTPAKAYFVHCDSQTTTQSDIDKGIVNIIVGFAPLKPAEFVVIKLQQIAGQIET
jgi:uncharacterized protein